MPKRKPSPPVSKSKAAHILRDASVMGHPLTDKQRGLFGTIAGGNYKGKKR